MKLAKSYATLLTVGFVGGDESDEGVDCAFPDNFVAKRGAIASDVAECPSHLLAHREIF